MKKPSSLYLLIKNLSKSEKTYIKKYVYRQDSQGEKRIQKVIAAYEKLKEYDLEKEKIIFLKEFNAKNIAASRSYVFDKITKVLGDYFSEHDEEIKLLEQLKHFHVLKRKNLLQQSTKEIKKLSKAAINGKITKLKYYILSQHYNLLTHNIEKNEEEILDISSEIIKQGNTISENGAASIAFVKCINLRKNIPLYCNTKEDFAKVKTLLQEPILHQENLTSPFAKLVVQRTKCQLWMLTGELERLSDYLEKSMLTIKFEELNRADALNFGTDLYSLSLALFWQKNYESFDKYRLLLFNLVNNQEENYQRKVIEAYLTTVQIFNYFSQKQTDKKSLDALINKMESMDKIQFSDQYLHFYWMLAKIHFTKKKYKNTLDVINDKIYNHPEINSLQIYLFEAKILEMMTLYDMELTSNLDSRSNSFKRMLKVAKIESPIGETVISYFKKLAKTPILEEKNTFKEFYQEIEKLAALNKSNQLLINNIGIGKWLAKKINI